MKANLSAFKPASLLSETLFIDGASFEFKLKVSGLWHTSTLAVTFGGVTKRITFRTLDKEDICLLRFPPSKGATVLKVRLDAYDDGYKIKHQGGDVAVELLESRLGEPVAHKGWLTWIAEKLGVAPKGGA